MVLESQDYLLSTDFVINFVNVYNAMDSNYLGSNIV